MHQAVEDLRRGIALLSFDVWTAARELSARLGGDAAFAAGFTRLSGRRRASGRRQLRLHLLLGRCG